MGMEVVEGPFGFSYKEEWERNNQWMELLN